MNKQHKTRHLSRFLASAMGLVLAVTAAPPVAAAGIPEAGLALENGNAAYASEAVSVSAQARSAPSVGSARAAYAAVPVTLGDTDTCGGGAILVDSVTYVPLRVFCTRVSGGDVTVSWNAQTRTATVRTGTLTLTAAEGAYYITANGRCFFTVGRIRNLGGTLYVPLRPMAKAFGLQVTWNAQTRSVTLSGNPRSYVLPSASETYNSDDLYWLSRIISAEARGEPFLGQIAVGDVVLNRKRSPQYPNTIYGVIFDRKYGTQFSPVSFGTIYKTPAASSVAAAKLCLEGYSVTSEAIYFYNPALATTSWIDRNCTYLFTIGTHRFYK